MAVNLTVTKVKNLKPEKGKRTIRLADGMSRGLYITAERSKIDDNKINRRWEFRNKTWHGIGSYPDVTLEKAREIAQNFRTIKAEGRDLSTYIKTQKALTSSSNLFNIIAQEWFNLRKDHWAPNTVKRNQYLLNILNKYFGNLNITTISRQQILIILDKVQLRGTAESLKKAISMLNSIMRYTVDQGKREYNPCTDLGRNEKFRSKKPSHYPCLTKPQDLKILFEDIEKYKNDPKTYYQAGMALTLAPYLFLRPIELVSLKWEYIDWTLKRIIIPAEKMKSGNKHIVPLATQVIKYLEALHNLFSSDEYIFPACHYMSSKKPHLNEQNLNMALKRLGYKDKQTAHGFRGTASTILHETLRPKHGWQSEVVELQLAHMERNKVKAAYAHVDYINDRTQMMQIWADYLDFIRKPYD